MYGLRNVHKSLATYCTTGSMEDTATSYDRLLTRRLVTEREAQVVLPVDRWLLDFSKPPSL